ncbi:MAG: phage holin family protein [Candidatus Omnitrophica bacterium]|nr:phage holin family protein [Candidatus Omnitrophota bacterium]
MKFLIKWFINVIALLVVIHVIAGVSIDNMQTVFVAALILGLLNSFIRPFILILTLPITIFTFGFFTLIINGYMFYLATKFIKGFVVAGFWNAFWAALLFSIISSVLSFIFTPKIDIRFNSFRSTGGGRAHIDKDDFIDVEGKAEDK